VSQRKSKLPAAARRELAKFGGDNVVVATVRTLALADLPALSHVGVGLENHRIVISPPAPPPRECGLYARRNLDGWTEKLRDRPMAPLEIDNWVPNWNKNGWHSVSRTVMAYPVRHHPAGLLTISAKVIEQLKDGAIVRFRVDQPIAREDPEFEDKVGFNLRLLREAVGDAQVFPADMTDQEFANLQRVDWEILPPGSADHVLKRLAAGKSATPERLKVAEERLRVLDRLGHDGYILGTGKFTRYFGIRFGDRLVAPENLEYGNALYVFQQDWERLSQLSRSDLIKRRDPGVHRIPHVLGWQSVVRKLLRKQSSGA
jgi:hypothetical protein